jgi:hypothetical protein
MTPFKLGPTRADTEGIARLHSTTNHPVLGPDTEPVAHVMLLASTTHGEVRTSGVVECVIDEKKLVLRLVHVSEESLCASFPQLVVLERSDPWALVCAEPLYSDSEIDHELEVMRAKIIASDLAQLVKRTQEAQANRFAALMFEKDRAWIEAAIARIRKWHHDTGRCWPIEE